MKEPGKINTKRNLIILFIAAILAFGPLLIFKSVDFKGTDDKAVEKIKETKPEYKPWFKSILNLPGKDTQTLLFAVQAALGAGFMGYFIGLLKGKRSKIEGKNKEPDKPVYCSSCKKKINLGVEKYYELKDRKKE